MILEDVPLVSVVDDQLYLVQVDARKPVLDEIDLIPLDLKALHFQDEVAGLRSRLKPYVANVFVELIIESRLLLLLLVHRVAVVLLLLLLSCHRRVRSRSVMLLAPYLKGILPHMRIVVRVLLISSISFAI